MLHPLPDPAAILRFHDGTLPSPGPGPVWAALADNHAHNAALWAQEDLARRRLAPDSAIAANKRRIDRHNQARNDAVETMDEALLALLLCPDACDDPRLRLNSETPGAMIDRLSVAALRLHHLAEQADRVDVNAAHRARCAAMATRVAEQRRDLAACLGALFVDCLAGRARFKTYRQFKMYNDPSLNPVLRQEAACG